MAQDDKQKQLELAMAQIERQYGKGAIMKMDDTNITQVPSISMGDIGLDIALGIGGIPQGRIIEIYGPESSGKTTLALAAIAELQKQGKVAAFIDAEHALDISNAKTLGVNVNDLLVSQPDHGEQALEIVDILIQNNSVDMIVVDSVAALVPKNELEGDMGDSHVGLQARLMSQALRKLTGAIGRTNITLIFINQLRMKIGVMFGNPETTTGGNALKFYSSVRMEVRKGPAIKKADVVTGHRIKVKVVKNKVAPPFRDTEVELIYGKGISKYASLIETAVNDGIVQKSGTWYSYGSDRIGQGLENAKNFLIENPQMAYEIESQVRELHNLPAPVPPAETKPATEKKQAAEEAAS